MLHFPPGSLLVHLGEQQQMAHMLRSLSPMWEFLMALAWPSPGHCGHLDPTQILLYKKSKLVSETEKISKYQNHIKISGVSADGWISNAELKCFNVRYL